MIIRKIKKILKKMNSLLIRLLNKRICRIIPDKPYLKIKYRLIKGKKINLKSPKSFNEKLQWLKLYDRKDVYTLMVDKYEVKKYVSDILGEDYIIPTLGVYNNFSEIDFLKLPKEFVLKCTHDSGGLVICRDNDLLDKNKANKKIMKCLKKNYYWSGREWPYKNVKPRIIAEKYMENNEQGLVDYKFFCFNGVPKFIYASKGLEDHSTAKISFFDLTGKKMFFSRSDFAEFDDFEMPENFDKMKDIAGTLAKKIECPFVRVDLYSVEGKIYFSEITFSPCGGFMPFSPSNADEFLGDMIDLNTINLKK